MALIRDANGNLVDDGQGPQILTQLRRGLVGTGELIAGAAGIGPAIGLDSTVRGAASLVGGDPNTLPGGPAPLTTAATQTLNQGYQGVSDAAASLRRSFASGAQSLLGVQPAPVVQQPYVATPLPVAAPTPAAPAIDTSPIIQQTAAQLTSQLPQPAVIQQPTAQTPAQPTVQTIQPLDNRGSNGINFGFSPGGASAYLAQKAQEDKQNLAARDARDTREDYRYALQELGQARQIGDIYSARQQLQYLAPQLATETQTQGRTMETVLNNATARQNAQLNALTSLQNANTTAQSHLQAAQIAGQNGLQVAGINAQGRVAAARTAASGPAGVLQLAQAGEIQARQTAADAYLAQGGNAEGYASILTSGHLPTPAKSDKDPLTDITYLPETRALLQARQLQQAKEEAAKAARK